MALYEMRTYTLRVGSMAEAVRLYQELGYQRSRKEGLISTSSATSRPTRAQSIN
jgi:hypothetical protein